MTKKKSTGREIMEYGIVILVAIIVAVLVRSYIGQLVVVKGNSMNPTFENKDIAISSIISYHKHKPKRGDIVIAQSDQLNERIIKRVVGIEGDTIEVKNGALYRNGKKIKESYIKEKMEGTVEKTKVEKNHLYVMGDNRNDSADSRILGALPIDKIKGKVVLELWNNPFKKVE
ncbi:signal peptidase I [Priestia megaterium]|nr:signal peptidase I [Priestia megaterium]